MLASGPTPNPLHPTLPHLSGFSYPELECSVYGKEIAWYNTQFYCGWGDAFTTAWYDTIIAAGWKPEKIVMGVVTNPGNGGGYVDVGRLAEVAKQLRQRYNKVGKGFGGIMGWEYFNAGDCDDDIAFVASLDLNNETVQAGWVKALGLSLRTDVDPDKTPTSSSSGAAMGGMGGVSGSGSGLQNITADQIRNMVSNLPAARAAWPDEEVQKLVVLGFSRQEALAALNATEGDTEMAAGFLFEHYPS